MIAPTPATNFVKCDGVIPRVGASRRDESTRAQPGSVTAATGMNAEGKAQLPATLHESNLSGSVERRHAGMLELPGEASPSAPVVPCGPPWSCRSERRDSRGSDRPAQLGLQATDGLCSPPLTRDAVGHGRPAASSPAPTWCAWCAMERDWKGGPDLRGALSLEDMRDCPRHSSPMGKASVFGLGSEAA